MNTPDHHTQLPSTTTPDDPLVGALVADRYRIVRRLGEGGMGVVYEGLHELINRRVAIKCLHSQYARRADVLTRFQREAVAATSIGNEHIVEVTDMGQLPDGGAFLVLEFLDGQDFASLIEDAGALPTGRVARIMMQLCEALAAAHARGIVHRDLKPENVYLIARGDNADFVKLLDFGIARFKDDTGDATALTRTGMAIGTPHYMSPEQADGRRDIDHRTDIYAVGVMLYYALTGAFPFEAGSFAALVVKIAHEPPPDPRRVRPDLPPPLAELIVRCLAKNRDARPPTCTEIRAALAPFILLDTAPKLNPQRSADDDRGVDPWSRTNAAPWMPERPLASSNRRGVLYGGAAGAVFALAIVGGLLGNRLRSSAPTVVVLPTASVASASSLPSAALDARPSALATPSASAAAPERSVRIRLSTQPPRAQVLLDGLPIANPFDGELPYSRELHRLEVRAPGYQDVLQDLALHLSQNVEVVLDAGRGVQDRRTARASAAPTAASAAAGAHAPPAPTANAAASPPRASALAVPTGLPARAEPRATGTIPAVRTGDQGGVAPNVPLQEF